MPGTPEVLIPNEPISAEEKAAADPLRTARHKAGTWMPNGSRPQAGRRDLRALNPEENALKNTAKPRF